jgi:predicted membrane channel-forming protein YqfA (hemolysin III family)
MIPTFKVAFFVFFFIRVVIAVEAFIYISSHARRSALRRERESTLTVGIVVYVVVGVIFYIVRISIVVLGLRR